MQSRTIARSLLTPAIAVLFAGLSACASTSRNQATYSAGNVSLTEPVVPPLAASEVDMLRRMTDPNILGHLAMGDSVEIVMAKFAEGRTKDDAVLDLARTMDVDHSTSLQRERDIAGRNGLGMQTMVGELKMSHMGTYVDSLSPRISELTFDHNYIMAQVQVHRHMLAELRTLQDVARDDAIRRHIAAAIPIVSAHYMKAHDLAVKRQYVKADER